MSIERVEYLIDLRRQIDRLLLDHIAMHGGYEAERYLIEQAAEQLASMTGRGGSTRALGEQRIVDLVKQFDNTSGDGFGGWPVSRFMAGREVVDNRK
jgi:hypothetical protein